MCGDEVGATIIPFPRIRIQQRVPSIEAVLAMAPSRSLMEALVDDVGLDRRDVAGGIGREFAYLRARSRLVADLMMRRSACGIWWTRRCSMRWSYVKPSLSRQAC